MSVGLQILGVAEETLSFVRGISHKIEALTLNVIVASTEEAS
jgi:hypothetical protein